MTQKKTDFIGTSADSGIPGVEVKQTMNGTIKTGSKTSEFWGKVVVQALVIISMFVPEANIDPQFGITIVSVLEAAYIAGRSILKAVHEKASGGRQRIPVTGGGGQ